MYLISIVYSEGLNGGRECVPVASEDAFVAITDAYTTYKAEVDAVRELLESEEVGFEEFHETMQRGFEGFDDLECVQYNGGHIQFEGTKIGG